MMDLIQILALPFAGCVIMGVMLSYLGIHVIKREVIFIDIATAQTAALGSLAAHLAFHVEAESLTAYACSLACVFVMAAFYAGVRAKVTQISLEVVIGVAYAITAAAAMLLIGIAPGHAHASEMLAGNLLWATWPEIRTILIAFCAVAVCLYALRKPLARVSETYREVRRHGWKTILWDFVFYALLGVVITLAVPILGVVVAFTMLIVPATTAALFTERTSLRMTLSTALVAVASVAGLSTSYYFDFSVGPTVAFAMGIILAIAAPLAALRPRERAKGQPAPLKYNHPAQAED